MGPDTKTAKDGMEQPFHQWTPSIGPSGLAFVTGHKYKGWNGKYQSKGQFFRDFNKYFESK